MYINKDFKMSVISINIKINRKERKINHDTTNEKKISLMFIYNAHCGLINVCLLLSFYNDK